MQSLSGISGLPKLVDFINPLKHLKVTVLHPFLSMYRVAKQDVNPGEVMNPYHVWQMSYEFNKIFLKRY